MPSIAKSLGLIFVVANPACLAAQTPRPNDGPHGRPDSPSIGQSFSSGHGARFGADTYEGALSAGNYSTASAQPVLPQGAAAAAMPLSPPGRESRLPLAPPGHSNRAEADRTGGLPSLVTVAGSLGVVLGVFFLVAWGIRRAAPADSMVLPGEVFEVLGRASMASRQQVHLLRCGKKLVLVSVTPAGAETLTEITDPVEVDRLAGLCRQAHPNSATAAFRKVFQQLTQQRPTTGLLGESDHEGARLATSGVVATKEGLENRDV